MIQLYVSFDLLAPRPSVPSPSFPTYRRTTGAKKLAPADTHTYIAVVAYIQCHTVVTEYYYYTNHYVTHIIGIKIDR